MKRNRSLVFVLLISVALWSFDATLPCGAETVGSTTTAAPGRPQVVPVTVTNWVPRLVTNVIEMRIPQNQFVDEYRTNWFEQFVTNTIDLYRTNLVTRLRTNQVVIERVQTQQVLAYQTNIVYAYQTNLKVLTLTNWENVLVMKTNWVRRPVTNIVEMEGQLPAPTASVIAPPVNVPPPATGEGKAKPADAPSPPTDVPQDLVFDLAGATGSTANNQIEVQMALKSVRDPAAILPVREWRVERSDNAVLVFGQRPEFKGQLPVGAYKVSAKVRLNEQSPIVTMRGEFEIASSGGNQRIPADVGNPQK